METKRCFKCKKIKLVSEFIQFKSGENKGYYYSYCKPCNKEHVKKYNPRKHIYYREVFLKKKPWIKTFIRISWRCNNKNQRYYKRGIKNYLTKEDLKFLWFRDKAWLLKKPSIDRINTDGDYTLENCRYIELLTNQKRPKSKIKTEYLN